MDISSIFWSNSFLKASKLDAMATSCGREFHWPMTCRRTCNSLNCMSSLNSPNTQLWWKFPGVVQEGKQLPSIYPTHPMNNFVHLSYVPPHTFWGTEKNGGENGIFRGEIACKMKVYSALLVPIDFLRSHFFSSWTFLWTLIPVGA